MSEGQTKFIYAMELGHKKIKDYESHIVKVLETLNASSLEFLGLRRHHSIK